jgi:hypothetical protein
VHLQIKLINIQGAGTEKVASKILVVNGYGITGDSSSALGDSVVETIG